MDAFATQRSRHAMAGNAARLAIGHYGAAGWQFFPPMVDVAGSTMVCSDDQSIIGKKRIVTANVDQHWSRSGSKAPIEFAWSNWQRFDVHTQSPRPGRLEESAKPPTGSFQENL